MPCGWCFPFVAGCGSHPEDGRFLTSVPSGWLRAPVERFFLFASTVTDERWGVFLSLSSLDPFLPATRPPRPVSVPHWAPLTAAGALMA